jgi:hypothetical protein
VYKRTIRKGVVQPVSARGREVEKGRRNVSEAVFHGFRCRLRPPAVCILYKPRETPPPGLPLPGGTVYEGLFTAAESRLTGRREFHCQRHLSV